MKLRDKRKKLKKNHSGQGHHHNTERTTPYTVSLDICALQKMPIEGRILVSSRGERFQAKG